MTQPRGQTPSHRNPSEDRDLHRKNILMMNDNGTFNRPDALFNDRKMFQKLDGLINLSLINDAV
mgnify:CR=1 FL=1